MLFCHCNIFCISPKSLALVCFEMEAKRLMLQELILMIISIVLNLNKWSLQRGMLNSQIHGANFMGSRVHLS